MCVCMPFAKHVFKQILWTFGEIGARSVSMCVRERVREKERRENKRQKEERVQN